MSYQFYKLLHFVGIFSLLISLAAILISHRLGDNGPSIKKQGFILHGISWLIVLTAGMGLAARLGFMTSFPIWLIAKIGIWLSLGIIIVFLRKRSARVGLNTGAILLLSGTAAWLAVYKPF